MGSAQQYQGSVRYGIVARAASGRSGNSPAPARSQIWRKISARGVRRFSSRLIGLLNRGAEAIERGVGIVPGVVQGARRRRGRRVARTSGSSSSSEPSGISRRIASWIGRDLRRQVADPTSVRRKSR